MHQKFQLVLSLGAALVLSLIGSGLVSASPITYTFTVTATDGPLSGTTEDGTFSYDSSSVVPGGQNTTPGLFTSLAFVWNGTAYDQTTANTGFLDFDATGNLTRAVFGNDCAAGCIIINGTNTWAINLSPPGGPMEFFYAVPGTEGSFIGSVTAARTVPVPEPTALAFLGLLGCVLVAAAERFRHSHLGRITEPTRSFFS